jgi:uncharacterized membrane protein
MKRYLLLSVLLIGFALTAFGSFIQFSNTTSYKSIIYLNAGILLSLAALAGVFLDRLTSSRIDRKNMFVVIKEFLVLIILSPISIVFHLLKDKK